MTDKYTLVALGNPQYNAIISKGGKERYYDIYYYSYFRGRILSDSIAHALYVLSSHGLRKIAWIGSVGVDYIHSIKRCLRSMEISDFAFILAPETTGFEVHVNGGKRKIALIGIAQELEIADIPDEYLNAEYILVAPSFNEIPLDMIKELACISTAKIILDPEGYTYAIDEYGRIFDNLKADRVLKVLEDVYIFKPNIREARLISKKDNIIEMLEVFEDHGADITILNMGAKGTMLDINGKYYYIPSYRINMTIDVLGSGGAFLGGFISSIMCGEGILKAVAYGNAVASLKVESYGFNYISSRVECEKRADHILRTMPRTLL